MASIRGRDTQPELQVRRALHARGFRFSSSSAQRMPGRPDVVLQRWKVAVFVHGCFWHWHGCSGSRLPRTNRVFWEDKLSRNVERDELAAMTLVTAGWRVVIVWECALRSSRARSSFEAAMDRLAIWIRADPSEVFFEL
ncbi:DNA mismatch endonuclease Vsr [Ramlibacter sp. XY19]|nr:DNA mismatch endonuclease Vsr [Ramlibacter paludis]